MAEIFTAPVLLGVSGASLMIAAAIVAVAITWGTATALVRGLLVLLVAGGVGALAVWLRRLHLVITSGSVGVVAMGFAGTSAVAFLGESPGASDFSAALGFLIAGAAGTVLARLKLPWVGPAAAVALTGFAVALTFTVVAQVPNPVALWALSVTGTVTALGLIATSGLWQWRAAQHIAVVGGLSWLVVTGVAAAMWLWFGDVTVGAAFAALVPVAALALLVRSKHPAVGPPAAVSAAVLASAVGPGVSSVAGGAGWHQLTALAGTIAVVVALGARLPAPARRDVLLGLVPGYSLAWALGVSTATFGTLERINVLTGPQNTSQEGLELDVWVGVMALLLAVAVAALRTWNLSELKVPAGVQQAVMASGPLAGVAAVVVLTLSFSDVVVGPWEAWVWAIVGVVLALGLSGSRKVWHWQVAQEIALWSGAVWIAVTGVVVAVWSWSGHVSVAGALAGLLPAAALVALERWLPGKAVTMSAALATMVTPSIGYSLGLTGWQQLVVVAGTIAVAVAVGTQTSRAHQDSIALGLAPGFTVVAVFTASYAGGSLVLRVSQAVADSISVPGFAGDGMDPIDVWAGVAALVTGLAVAGVRLWRLRDLGREGAHWLRRTSVVGALMVVAGVITAAAAVADMASAERAHVTLASALSVAAVLLILARALWTDPVVKNVSSGSAVVLAGLAGTHGVLGLSMGELPVLAGLGIALVPVAVVALWGSRRPVEGTILATLLASATVAALASALGAPVTLALATAVGVAAGAGWTVVHLPQPQQKMVLMGVSPALGWGLIAGLGSGFEALRWLDPDRWAPDGWIGVAALTAAVALASLRVGPWRAWARAGERVGVVLVALAAPVAFAAGARALGLGTPVVALGAPILGALVIAAGLAWWRDSNARRLARMGAVGWVSAAGAMGWLKVAYGPWELGVTVALSLVTLGLLLVASRRWPRMSLAPTAALLTAAPVAMVVRAEWSLTAQGTGVMAGVVLAVLLLFVVPQRMRVIGLIGVLPGLAAGAAGALGLTVIAAVEAVTGGRFALVLEDHWWALGLVALLIVAVGAIGRLGVARSVSAAADVMLALALVAGVIVATAALAMVTAPDAPGDSTRLLSTPAIAAVLGAAVIAGAMRWERTRVGARRDGGSDGAGTHVAPAPTRPVAPAVARWGAVAWVLTLGGALHVWVFREEVPWLAGVGVVVALAVGLVVVGMRWPYLGLVPAVVLVTVLPFAVVPVTMAVPFAAAACGAALLVAAGTWAARLVTAPQRKAILLGLIPAAVGVVVPATIAILLTIARLAEHVGDVSSPGTAGGSEALMWWHVGVFAAGVVALLGLRDVQRHRGWLLFSVVVVTSAALPRLWAVVLLSTTSLSLLFAGRWLRTGSVAAGVSVGFAMVWSVGSDLALGVTSLTATVITGAVALGWRTRAVTWGAIAAPVTALIAGVFLTRGIDAAQVDIPAGVGLAMVTALVLVSARRDYLRDAVAYTAIGVTLLVPLFAGTTAMMGLAYLLGAATWWRLFTAGLAWAKWTCTIAASAGAAALLASIDIQVIEAYTATPAIALLLIGIQWMRDNPHLRSITALAPGLGAALVPSYLALILEPDELMRTIALVGAIIALAFVGLRLRWFAPVLATAVTAIVLSVLQIIAGGNLVVRLIAFAVVGALLLAVASYFEKLKELR